MKIVKKIYLYIRDKSIYISKNIHIPFTNKITLYEFMDYFFLQISTIGINQRASAISFNLIMALPAALLFLFTLIPYFPDEFNVKKELFLLLKDVTPNSNTYKFIEDLSNSLNKKRIGVFSFGFILIIFYSSNAMMGVIQCFDKSINEYKKHYFYARLRALKVTFFLFFLFFTSLTFLFLKDQVFILIKNNFLITRKILNPYRITFHWIIIIVSLFLSIGLIYRYAPNVKKKWRLISWGSILATVFNLLTIYIFYNWVNNYASYNKVYGSIGTVIILLFLIYLNAFVLLIGFEINVSMHKLNTTKNIEK